MAEQKIELRKVRDFGMNINDTFVFLKQNLKSLLGAFFAICSLFMLGLAIFNGLYQAHNAGVFESILKGVRYGNRGLDEVFTLEYFMIILFSLLTYAAMKTVIGCYMKYYLENDGKKPGIEDVWILFRKYILKILLYSIPIYLLIIVGCVMCLIPGIYLAVVFAPFGYIVIVEDLPFSESYSRCFEIIRNNFWISLAIYIVSYIIYAVSSSIISLIVGLMVGLITYFSTNNIATTFSIVTSFLNIFSLTFYIIYLISIAFQYFTLVEQRDGTGMLKRIENIGDDNTNFNNIEEQY